MNFRELLIKVDGDLHLCSSHFEARLGSFHSRGGMGLESRIGLRWYGVVLILLSDGMILFDMKHYKFIS